LKKASWPELDGHVAGLCGSCIKTTKILLLDSLLQKIMLKGGLKHKMYNMEKLTFKQQAGQNQNSEFVKIDLIDYHTI
jgi:hypothetical protein